MTPPLIGLMGRARSGKDTAARFLIEEHGFTRYAFADPIKTSALALDPLVLVENDEIGPLREAGLRVSPLSTLRRLSEIVEAVGWEAAKEVREVRRTLQRFGTGLREEVDSEIWVAPVIRRALASGAPAAITDVRFLNEAEAIHAAGGRLVRIFRPSHHLPAEGLHVSETALDDYPADATVRNDSDLALFRYAVLKAALNV